MFKCVLIMLCPKSGNEKTMMILLSLFWFPECWFGLVMFTYKLLSQYTEPVTHSHSWKECWDCVIWLYHDFPFVEHKFLVAVFAAWNVSDVLETLYFVIGLNNIILLPQVCQVCLILCCVNRNFSNIQLTVK